MRDMKRACVVFFSLLTLAGACSDDDATDLSGDGGVADGATSPPTGGSSPPPGDASAADTLVAPAVDCSNLATTAQLAGAITVDQTWQGVIAVTSDVSVRDGAKITIAAGTVFVMASDTSIEFGWNSNVSSVFARGTAVAPIRFCGKQNMTGFWQNIIVRSKVTSDSVFEHVIISGAGSGKRPALQNEMSLLVKDVRVENAADDGVVADDFQTGSARLSVAGAAKTAVALTGQGAATNFPVGGTFTGNGKNVVAVRFNVIDADTTFKNPGVPYLQEGDVSVRNGAKVTFEAGVNYSMFVDTSLEFGWNSNVASLFMNGTAAAPIVFDRVDANAGFFSNIIVRSNVTSDSIMKHVTIRGGGAGNNAALNIQAPIKLENVTLDGNQTAGLNLDGQGLSATSANLTITNTMGPAATIEPDAMVSLPKGGTFTGNQKQYIEVAGGALNNSGTIPDLDIPFRVAGITTRSGSALTIEAGTEFIMAPDSSIEFGWNSNEASIIAEGTAAKPIVFRGGDAVAGYWRGITIRSKVLSNSKFAYVHVMHGGRMNEGALQLDKTFNVSNSKFSMSAGYGITKRNDDPTDYAVAGNTFEMNAQGNVGPN